MNSINKELAKAILREIEENIESGQDIIIITKNGKQQRCSVETGCKEIDASYKVTFYNHTSFGSFDCFLDEFDLFSNIMFPNIHYNKL